MSVTARVREQSAELSGAVADLGVLVPIAAALVLRSGFDAATLLVGVGALYLLAGLYFRVPVPVQPIKAAAAIAISRELAPEVLAAAGVILGGVLLVLGASGASGLIVRLFAKPVVRGLQLGVGLILVKSAWTLGGDASAGLLLVAAVVVVLLAAGSGSRRPVALAVVAGGVLWSLIREGGIGPVDLALWHPEWQRRAFDRDVLMSALTLLVIPQIPLTFGNAVVALADLEHHYYGARARRVTPRAVSLSCGVANVAIGSLGGMPMCHGSGGLTAHHRAGARTNAMNAWIGGTLLAGGLFLGPVAFEVLALIPLPVLMGLLAFTGLAHSGLVRDLRGYPLAVAVVAGVAGAWAANLAVTLVIGLACHWVPRLVSAVRGLPAPGARDPAR